jgi:PD-(D/E)XK nuclease superfamily protein
MAPLKKKGDLAELKVAADLIDRGCRISIPFGEDHDYDLIADYEGRLHRVQVKYTQSDGDVVVVRCRSHSLTKGKVRATKLYTAAMIDWIAAYDTTSDRCYYCPSWQLGATGRTLLHLRLQPTRNNQRIGIREAAAYTEPDFSRDPSVEPAGFEPATSSVQATRSAN